MLTVPQCNHRTHHLHAQRAHHVLVTNSLRPTSQLGAQFAKQLSGLTGMLAATAGIGVIGSMQGALRGNRQTRGVTVVAGQTIFLPACEIGRKCCWLKAAHIMQHAELNLLADTAIDPSLPGSEAPLL